MPDGVLFDAAVLLVGLTAGAVASITGFGIGSLLTPLLSLRMETKIAVAAVSIPHVIGTAVRFWKMRRDVDRTLLWKFGVPSALGGLTGAVIHTRVESMGLT